jgi:hypothetical protein
MKFSELVNRLMELKLKIEIQKDDVSVFQYGYLDTPTSGDAYCCSYTNPKEFTPEELEIVAKVIYQIYLDNQ